MRIALRPPPLSYPLKLLAVYSAAALVVGLLFLIAVTMTARPWIGSLVVLAYLIGVLTARFWRRPGRINHVITRLLHQM
jgi:hypothetical protein